MFRLTRIQRPFFLSVAASASPLRVAFFASSASAKKASSVAENAFKRLMEASEREKTDSAAQLEACRASLASLMTATGFALQEPAARQPSSDAEDDDDLQTFLDPSSLVTLQRSTPTTTTVVKFHATPRPSDDDWLDDEDENDGEEEEEEQAEEQEAEEDGEEEEEDDDEAIFDQTQPFVAYVTQHKPKEVHLKFTGVADETGSVYFDTLAVVAPDAAATSAMSDAIGLLSDPSGDDEGDVRREALVLADRSPEFDEALYEYLSVAAGCGEELGLLIHTKLEEKILEEELEHLSKLKE